MHRNPLQHPPAQPDLVFEAVDEAMGALGRVLAAAAAPVLAVNAFVVVVAATVPAWTAGSFACKCNT